jgi:hypothetical protein
MVKSIDRPELVCIPVSINGKENAGALSKLQIKTDNFPEKVKNGVDLEVGLPPGARGGPDERRGDDKDRPEHGQVC